jgi:D-amino peptidase
VKKLFISADIEGTCGIADWKETEPGCPFSDYFTIQMSKEAGSAALAAEDSGYGEIIIKDAHDSARNIRPELLPQSAKLLRGWTNDPLCMMSGLDGSFTAAAFTGYHSPAYSGGSPLCHTMTTSVMSVRLNGEYVSEFTLNAYTAAWLGVPVVLVTGDEYLCEQAKKLIPEITAVPVVRGIGGGTLSVHPDKALKMIYEGAKSALAGDVSKCLAKLPESFTMEVTYKRQPQAYRCSFFPGAKLSDPNTVVYTTDNYKELLGFGHFCL